MEKVLDRFQVGQVIMFMNSKSHNLEVKRFKRDSNDKDWNKMGQADAWAKAAEWIQETIGDSAGLITPVVADIEDVGDYLVAVAPAKSLFNEMRDYADGFDEARADVVNFIDFVITNMGQPKEDD